MISEQQAVENYLRDLFGFTEVVCFGRARSALVTVIELLYPQSQAAVVLPSNICPSLIAAVVAASAKPVLAAVNPLTGLADANSCREAMRGCDQPGLLILANLYGYDGQFAEITKQARESGWYVIESDVSGVRAGMGPASEADALLVSFGSGKVIDGGAGGALLVNDAELAKDLNQIKETYPVLNQLSEQNEMYLNSIRRLLTRGMPSGQSLAGLYEDILPYEIADIRHRLDNQYYPLIHAALKDLPENRERRVDKAQYWLERLTWAGNGAFKYSPLQQLSPWRFIVRLAEHRDALVAWLRSQDIDVGTNYPSLVTYFPRLLMGYDSIQSTQWHREVLNFWVSDDYDNAKIDGVALRIRQYFDNQHSVSLPLSQTH